jgi:hypothetical protein
MVEDPEVFKSVRQRLIAGTLPEEVEIMLWEEAFNHVQRSTTLHLVPSKEDDAVLVKS